MATRIIPDETPLQPPDRRKISWILVLGLCFIALFGFLFGHLAEDVVTNDPIVIFDKTVSDTFHAQADPQTTQWMFLITRGGYEVINVIGIIWAITLIARHHWRMLFVLALVIPGAWLLNSALKSAFNRPRPVFNTPLVVLDTLSFPSGHATSSMVFYGFLVYLVARRGRNPLAWVAASISALGVIGLIGVSRVYLGAHYPSDVLGGYLSGAIWLVFVILADRWLRRRGALRQDAHVAQQMTVNR